MPDLTPDHAAGQELLQTLPGARAELAARLVERHCGRLTPPCLTPPREEFAPC